MGGIGKTQLALEYAWRHAGDFDLVWWLRAEQPATLLEDYAALARPLELPEAGGQELAAVAAAVRQSLARRDRWLLVFDNASRAQRPGAPPAAGRRRARPDHLAPSGLALRRRARRADPGARRLDRLPARADGPGRPGGRRRARRRARRSAAGARPGGGVRGRDWREARRLSRPVPHPEAGAVEPGEAAARVPRDRRHDLDHGGREASRRGAARGRPAQPLRVPRARGDPAPPARRAPRCAARGAGRGGRRPAPAQPADRGAAALFPGRGHGRRPELPPSGPGGRARRARGRRPAPLGRGRRGPDAGRLSVPAGRPDNLGAVGRSARPRPRRRRPRRGERRRSRGRAVAAERGGKIPGNPRRIRACQGRLRAGSGAS